MNKQKNVLRIALMMNKHARQNAKSTWLLRKIRGISKVLEPLVLMGFQMKKNLKYHLPFLFSKIILKKEEKI